MNYVEMKGLKLVIDKFCTNVLFQDGKIRPTKEQLNVEYVNESRF